MRILNFTLPAFALTLSSYLAAGLPGSEIKPHEGHTEFEGQFVEGYHHVKTEEDENQSLDKEQPTNRRV